MRVTGGRYVRREIRVPKGEIRPAMDRMRESVFSIIRPGLENASFLDLFSGSGIIGIEAASRGAHPVVLVEMDRRKRPVIVENISIVETEISVVIRTAEGFLSSCARSFDYVFLDPPFAYRDKDRLVALVHQNGVLENGGILMMHHPTGEEIAGRVGDLEIYDRRTYGGSEVVFYTERDRDSAMDR